MRVGTHLTVDHRSEGELVVGHPVGFGNRDRDRGVQLGDPAAAHPAPLDLGGEDWVVDLEDELGEFDVGLRVEQALPGDVSLVTARWVVRDRFFGVQPPPVGCVDQPDVVGDRLAGEAGEAGRDRLYHSPHTVHPQHVDQIGNPRGIAALAHGDGERDHRPVGRRDEHVVGLDQDLPVGGSIDGGYDRRGGRCRRRLVVWRRHHTHDDERCCHPEERDHDGSGFHRDVELNSTRGSSAVTGRGTPEVGLRRRRPPLRRGRPIQAVWLGPALRGPAPVRRSSSTSGPWRP